jgi:two-component system chemotaxis response regulator CheY
MPIRALVAEDSPAMRQLIVFALRRVKDLEVEEAVDGANALKALANKRYDILLTDINMPIMDGLKLISLVRQDETHFDIPIIVITTEGAQADRERAMALGANAYITKPIRATQVVDCVNKLLAS